MTQQHINTSIHRHNAVEYAGMIIGIQMQQDRTLGHFSYLRRY